MFVIFLRLTAERGRAPAFMEAHRDWIARGRADGIFLLVGSLPESTGGAILAHGESRAEIEARVAQDPFVAEGIADAEIHEFTPALVDERLQFLAG